MRCLGRPAVWPRDAVMAPLASAHLLPDDGHLVARLGELSPLDYDLLLCDITSVYYEGGGDGRRDYGVIGAVTTLAARLCSMARACRILAPTVLLLLAGIFGLPPVTVAMTVQEAILRAKPAAVLIISQIGADIIMNCGKGPVSVSPTPFVETGSGWFVDGRGHLVTSAHVVLPPSATFELKKTAIQEGCVDPELRARSLVRGQRPDVEERIRGDVTDRAMATMKVTPSPSVTVLLSNGTRLPAEVKKVSPPLGLDAKGAPLPDSGRDLALLRVKDGVYPALDISTKGGQLGDAVHILGFPGLILTHELLDRSISLEASVTNGAISGFRRDAIGQDVIQTDAPATYGNSGGPAIGNDATLVGVMTFVSLSPLTGTVVQGFNFLIPAKDVRKFLEGTDVHIGEGRFNTPWADALWAFFKGDYRAAAVKLTKVNTILPNLPDVKRVLGEAQEKAKHSPPGPVPWSWVALAVTLVSMGVYGGLPKSSISRIVEFIAPRMIASVIGSTTTGRAAGLMCGPSPSARLAFWPGRWQAGRRAPGRSASSREREACSPPAARTPTARRPGACGCSAGSWGTSRGHARAPRAEPPRTRPAAGPAHRCSRRR